MKIQTQVFIEETLYQGNVKSIAMIAEEERVRQAELAKQVAEYNSAMIRNKASDFITNSMNTVSQLAYGNHVIDLGDLYSELLDSPKRQHINKTCQEQWVVTPGKPEVYEKASLMRKEYVSVTAHAFKKHKNIKHDCVAHVIETINNYVSHTMTIPSMLPGFLTVQQIAIRNDDPVVATLLANSISKFLNK